MHIVLLYRFIRTCTGLIVACAGIRCTSFTGSSSIFRLNSYFSSPHLITTTTILTARCPRGKCRLFAIYCIEKGSKLYHHIQKIPNIISAIFLSFNNDPNSYLGMAVDCIRDLPILHQRILYVEYRQPQLQVHGSILGALIWIVNPLRMIGYRASMLNMAPIDKPLFNRFMLCLSRKYKILEF